MFLWGPPLVRVQPMVQRKDENRYCTDRLSDRPLDVAGNVCFSHTHSTSSLSSDRMHSFDACALPVDCEN